MAAIVDPRGARPMEHGYKADKCATEKEWPFCTDDDWVGILSDPDQHLHIFYTFPHSIDKHLCFLYLYDYTHCVIHNITDMGTVNWPLSF